MERSGTLDLRLFASNTYPSAYKLNNNQLNLSRDDDPWSVNQQEIITIFYNGRACSFDLTELQARTIILLASQGFGGTIGNKARRLEASSIPMKEGNRLYRPYRGLSLRKSLERFLQERKRRAKATSPPYGQMINQN